MLTFKIYNSQKITLVYVKVGTLKKNKFIYLILSIIAYLRLIFTWQPLYFLIHVFLVQKF